MCDSAVVVSAGRRKKERGGKSMASCFKAMYNTS